MKKNFCHIFRMLLVCLTLCCFTNAWGQNYQTNFRDFEIAERDGKFGLLYRGTVVAPYIYDTIEASNNNHLFITRQGNKVGAITTTVSLSRKTSVRAEWSFMIDKEGRTEVFLTASVIPCRYDSIEYSDGKFRVSRGDKKEILTYSKGKYKVIGNK